MDKRITECMENRFVGKYILPFFWQHGEPHDILREEIEAIYSCGIDQFCVESRVHEDFCGDTWWEDFGFLLEEAKKRSMKVWLLDDKRFPTGYANNYIETHPELRCVHMRMEFRDIAGPARDSAILPVPLESEEEIISAVAYRRCESDENKVEGEGVQLLPFIESGLIWWDVPVGLWRIYYLIRTHQTVEKIYPRRKYYIDPMSRESCRAMLYAVYEPHFEHFKEYFGNTFIGFFSDEPGFFNDDRHYFSTLGRQGMMVPWNDDVPRLMAGLLNVPEDKVLKLLPALWDKVNDETAEVRVKFMDIVTDAFSSNIGGLLGNWCRERGMEYIGHIIEDENAHQRLGCGGGHYFKALAGMDMAGCDIVLHQILPGYLTLNHASSGYGGRCNPAFFRYTLPKLASSLAHIDPLKNGRAMCEIFGAFGWTEGIPEMKYLADHMLVGGLNRFVPHAFSTLYPDPDCPPHFYCNGHNPQFESFKNLMNYMQKTCHILSDGLHCADVVVYYNAEAEWSGCECMLQQDVCMVLTRNQIDFDLIPQSVLCEDAFAEGNRLRIRNESYGAVVVPYSQYLPQRVISTLNDLAEKGVAVIYADGYPENAAANGEAVTLKDIPGTLRGRGISSFATDKPCPTLRYFHIRRGGEDIYMLWNESSVETVDVNVTVLVEENAIFYDVWDNRAYNACRSDKGIRIRLMPEESLIMTHGDEVLPLWDYRDGDVQKLNLEWTVSKLDRDKPIEIGRELKNYAKDMPYFGGKLVYEAQWEVSEKLPRILELGRFGEIAELWINSEFVGTAVSQYQRFHIDKFVKPGWNNIRIVITVNQGYWGRDKRSSFVAMPPMGLIGPICTA